MKGSQAQLLLCMSLCSSITGFILKEVTSCNFGNKTGENVIFNYHLSFNRLPIVMYNTSGETFQSDTTFPFADNISSYFNSDPDMMKEMEEEEKRCEEEAKEFWGSTVERRVEPSMIAYLSEAMHVESSQVLVCHIWGFYPKDIKVAWVKNQNTVLGNYSEADTVGDWTYRILVTLDVTDAQSGDIYECVVQHSSIKDLIGKKWERGLDYTQKIKISISTIVFALGLISIITGLTLRWMANKSGFIPITEYNEEI
ncbi:class II histocompatibility antigen, M beta 1 chain-like [Discoglossus pictus]